ncbi:MAG: S8 family serine peptidase [Bacteroidales bacterium]|nr:S8 family serine peptidase [Bacteroidales bacterium]
MNLNRFALCFLLLLGLVSCNKTAMDKEGEKEQKLNPQKGIISHPAGTYFVRVSDAMADLPTHEIRALIPAELQVRDFEKVISSHPQFEDRHRKAGLHKWYRVRCDSSHTKSTHTLKHFRESLEELFEKVETPPAIRMEGFNDPYASTLWNFQAEKYGTNVPMVWKKGFYGNSESVVAVLDGGIDPQHEDLKDILIPAGPEGSYNFVADTDSIVPNQHGTHVGGLVGAINNNGLGTCSAAGGKDGKGGIKILNCQIFQPNEKGEDVVGNYYNAFIWATDHGAHICNNSWSFVYQSNEAAQHARLDELTIAVINYFVDNAGCDGYGEQKTDSPMKGGLVLFAAGNEGLKYGLPASYERVLAVGSNDNLGERAYYSNYGDWVDICAPGGTPGSLILSTLPSNSSQPRGRYGKMGGTSMASPQVASIAALVLEKHGKQGFTQEMLKEKLIQGSRIHNPLPHKLQIGPLVDAYGALCYGDSLAPKAVENFQAKVELQDVRLSWEAADDGSMGTAHQYIISWSEDRDKLENRKNPGTPENGITDLIIENGDFKTGECIDTCIHLPKSNQNYYLSICAQDYCGNLSESHPIQQIVTTTPPPDIGEVNVYPNPVIDLLRISYGEEKEFDIHLYNSAGQKIYQGKQWGSASSPAVIDMSGYAPGIYQLVVCYENASFRKTIIK